MEKVPNKLHGLANLIAGLENFLRGNLSDDAREEHHSLLDDLKGVFHEHGGRAWDELS